MVETTNFLVETTNFSEKQPTLRKNDQLWEIEKGWGSTKGKEGIPLTAASWKYNYEGIAYQIVQIQSLLQEENNSKLRKNVSEQ